MHRVVVTGNAGGGKSTLCERLGAILDLPVYSLDRLVWDHHNAAAPARHLDHVALEWIGGERWIIDGLGTWEIVRAEFARADTIVFVDHPLWVHYAWVLKRRVRALCSTGANRGVKLRIVRRTAALVRTIWHTHRQARPVLLSLLAAERGRRRVVHLRSPRELDRFLCRCRELSAARMVNA